LGNRIARRGLYVDEVSAARIDTAKVAALIADDEFGDMQPEPIEGEAEHDYQKPPDPPINLASDQTPVAQQPAAVATASPVLEAEPELQEGDTQPIQWPAAAPSNSPINLDEFVWGRFLKEGDVDSEADEADESPTVDKEEGDDEEASSF
jgi:hypothetical protein